MIGRWHAGPLASVVVLLVLAAGACAPGDDQAADRSRAEEVEAELAQARDRIRELEAELAVAPGEPAEGEPAAGEPEEPGTPAAPGTAEGLVEQLHTYFPGDALDDGVQPGTTAWEATDVPAGFAQADSPDHATPGELVTALAGALAGGELGSAAWEVAGRVLVGEGEEATAAVLTWGLADDAIAGSDLRLFLTRGDTGWYVDSAEERFHCRRGVSDGLCA